MTFFTTRFHDEISIAMKTVISAKDIDELLRKGGNLNSLPADALLTPSARDRLHEIERPSAYRGGASTAPASNSKPISSKSPKAEIDAFFNSPQIHALKE